MNHSVRTLEEAVKKARKFEKFCEECGARMMTAYTTTRHCSDHCRKTAYNRKVRATEEPTEIITCGHCEKKFPWYKKINNKRKKFCSRQCAAKSGNNKGNRGVKNSLSLLTEKPSNIERATHCHRKTGPFEVRRCANYHLWGETRTQFHCDCAGGFTL